MDIEALKALRDDVLCGSEMGGLTAKRCAEIVDELDAILAASQPAQERNPAFACDYARMWDLVRSQRSELLDAGLITREEYATLLADETAKKPGQGSPSARRLESYDELRAGLAAARAKLAAIKKLATAVADERGKYSLSGYAFVHCADALCAAALAATPDEKEGAPS